MSANDRSVQKLPRWVKTTLGTAFWGVVIGQSTIACRQFGQQSTSSETTNATNARAEALNDSMLSPQYKSMREKFLNVADKSQFQKWLSDTDAAIQTSKMPNDVIFTGALATIAVEFESFTFRCIPLIEDYKSLRSMLINWLMANAAIRNTYWPTQQAEGLFRYLTEPPEQGAAPASIDSVPKLQSALYKIADRLKQVHDLLSTIKITNQPIIFDHKMAYGTGTFGDDINRYYEIGDAELQATLASLAMSIHGIYIFNAYHMDDLMQVSQNIGHLFGVDGFRWGDPEGTTSRKKVEQIKKHPAFWTLKTDTGKKDMEEAYKYFVIAVNHANAAYNALKLRDKTDEKELKTFDHFFINPMRQSLSSLPNRKAVDNLLAMSRGPTKLRSQLTGEEVTVNIKEFYLNPPTDMKRLLPEKFLGEGKTEDDAQFKTTASGVKYRNYLWGSPTDWNDKEYSGFIDLAGVGNIQKASRILVQSWGGWLGAPLVAMAL